MRIISLKKATIADIPALLELEKSVAGTKIYSPTLTKNEWKEELQKSEVYLIEKNNVVAGSLLYEKNDNENIYIGGLVINPRFQGQGIAREAMVIVLEKFKGVKRIDLVTHPDNIKAINLYQSLGFIIESRKKNYYGDGEPRIVMARILKCDR